MTAKAKYPKSKVTYMDGIRAKSSPTPTPVSPLSPEKKLIVLPAYNEEKNIGRVLDSIQSEVPEIPILVVDDGSSDSTAKIAQSRGVQVISLPFNSGYGVTLQTGFRYAVQNNYSLVVQMDADGQHDPHSIKDLIREVESQEVDVAIGSRFLEGSGYKTTFARRMGIYIFGFLASIIIRQKVTDPTSGFQALKGEAIRFVAGDHYPPDYPDADFIILLHRWGFKIKETPVVMLPSGQNKSMHYGSKPLYYVFKMFLSIFVTLLRRKPENW